MRELGYVRPDGEPNVHALHEKAGTAYGTLHAIVHGETRNPRSETLEPIARALRVDPMYLVYGDQPPEALGAFRDGVRFAIRAIRHAAEEVEREAESRTTTPGEGTKEPKSLAKKRASAKARGGKSGQKDV